MSPPNGRANASAVAAAAAQTTQTHALHELPTESSGNYRFSQQEINDFCAALDVPFEPSVIDWRVTNTSKNGKPRGQVIPYADQRAYIDRLNQLFTPAGWTRKYQVHTSANFERSKDQKTVAKVFVTCELSITGLGTHSATGEEWADDENAGTSAEAQAFKRSCACFGLGRYLYHFDGVWVDLDDRKRPRTVPGLPQWATPEGWRRGLRHYTESASKATERTAGNNGTGDGHESGKSASFVREIEQMEPLVGKRMYRGVLKAVARVWNPKDIQDVAIQQKVLTHMQAAERGFRRLDAALERVGPEALTRVLLSLKLQSIDRADNLSNLASDRSCARIGHTRRSSEPIDLPRNEITSLRFDVFTSAPRTALGCGILSILERKVPWKLNHQTLSNHFHLSKPQPRQRSSRNANDWPKRASHLWLYISTVQAMKASARTSSATPVRVTLTKKAKFRMLTSRTCRNILRRLSPMDMRTDVEVSAT
jgi:hypothetical protein